MADVELKQNDPPRGNEWEVVTLTASAYAAAPGPERADPAEEDGQDKLEGKQEAETSSAMFLSKHFVFPPSQHENLPLEPEYNEEIHSEKGIEEVYVSQLVKEEGVKSDFAKDGENATFEGLISDEFPGISVFDDKGSSMSDVALGNAQSIYGSAQFRSFRGDTTIGMSTNAVEGEDTDDDSVEPLDSSALQDPQKSVEGDQHVGVGLPCEAWWKRRAFSMYAHAKETNTFWSVFIAAAVMGLVIIGHRWQQERWKVLHLKYDERMRRMVVPISRFKDVIVGGHQRGSLVRGASSGER